LEASEPVMAAVTGMEMEVRRGENVVFHTRHKFADYL
jgi:hypothetical protein